MASAPRKQRSFAHPDRPNNVAATYPNLTGDLDAGSNILTLLNNFAKQVGKVFNLTSGYRSYDEQKYLWDNSARLGLVRGKTVAAPGSSNHQRGTAADVTVGGRAIQQVFSGARIRQAGLVPLAGDAPHVELPNARTASPGRFRGKQVGPTFTAPRTSGKGTPADWLSQAGWPADAIPIMVAIGGAESGWRINATHTNDDGSEDDGWLQINSVHGFDKARLRSDPVYTAEAGLKVWKSQGFGAWVTYTSGAYKRFMGQTPTVSGGGTASPGVTRPGGGGDSAGGPSSDGPSIDDVLASWASLRDGDTEGDTSSSGDPNNPNKFVGLGFGIPGFPGVPVPVPGGLDPLKRFFFDPTNFSKSVHDTLDFFKLLAWIINPVNILRMVELLIGMALMGFGFQAMLQAYGESKEGFVTSENPLSRSGLGRVSREVSGAAKQAAMTAAAPEAAVAKGATAGKAAKGAGGKSKGGFKFKIKPEAAPHRTRRQALRLRYDREKQVSGRRAQERRTGG